MKTAKKRPADPYDTFAYPTPKDRQPENRIAWEVDAQGWVTRVHLVGKDRPVFYPRGTPLPLSAIVVPKGYTINPKTRAITRLTKRNPRARG